MKYFNESLSLSESLIFLLVVSSGLIPISPMFTVPAVVIGAMWIVAHVMRVADVQTQELLLKDATAKYQAMAQREFALNERIDKLESQVESLRSSQAITFGSRK